MYSLAQEREAYLRNKRLHQEEMKTALDNQVQKQMFFLSLTCDDLLFIGPK